ncbi:hypothetical protein H5410_001129 [Solanum commersonii]|uniref:Acyl-[acyl-carrier-protein] desaturase n=1 Tax=Solanum commersonii TaxID=4109 RepID=A0A9J6AY89_SOLCO|nr:hypothetical protein H5410_001129 [Solanum commersonii]
MDLTPPYNHHHTPSKNRKLISDLRDDFTSSEKYWQPSEFLPDASQGPDGFIEEFRALRQRVLGLSDEYFVILLANMLVAWAVEEYRHGDLLRTYIYLSGRVDMMMIEKTMQYMLRVGLDNKTENNSYLGFVYTSIQERATFFTHGNMARLAKEARDPVLAHICGTIASDEKRHESAYTKNVEKLLEVDPNATMLAFAHMIKNRIVMPMHLMCDGEDSNMYENFSVLAQRLGVYTNCDYAEVIDFFITQWKLEKFEGLTGEARRA